MPGFDLLDPAQAPKGHATLAKTPFLDDQRFDEASFARGLKHVVDVGTKLAIIGMVGSETYGLADAERVRSMEIAIDVCGDRVPVCAAVAGLSVEDVVTAARRADSMDVDMIAVVPPPWSRNEADIVFSIKAVSDAVSLPIMIHSIGGNGVTLSTDTLASLPADAPNVRYLKEEAQFASRRVARVLETPGGHDYLRIMSGPPLVLGYLAGARLFMGAADNVDLMIAVFDALEAGDRAEAWRVDALVNGITYFKSQIASESGNKMIMQRRGIFPNYRVMHPSARIGLEDLTPTEEEWLTEVLRSCLPLYAKDPPSPPA